MKTARAHRKFAIYSIYLDTLLEGEEPILDGETRKDTLKRILKELEETAVELKKEAESMTGQFVQDALRGARESFPPIGPATQQVIQTEKGPDNYLYLITTSPSLEDLKTYKTLASNNKDLYDAYCKRIKELS